MDGIIAMAHQWLAGTRKESGVASATDEHIIESLLAEIQRIEAINAARTEEVRALKADRADETRRATAEECAVICETADYLVRSYGCAREIRKHFGLPY